jgi:histidine triad (HIT) family protein
MKMNLCIAINDINPQAPIHILLIPKKPIKKLSDCKKEDKDF